MRVKSLAFVIVLNIGLTLFISIVMEYTKLTVRVQNAENTVQQCLDAALDISTASEELFTEKAQAELASIASYGNQRYVSYGYTRDTGEGFLYGKSGESDLVFARTTLFMDGRFRPINAYQLARYYDQYHTLPTRVSQMASLNSETDQMTKIYKFLFGESGQEYTNSGLSWANRSVAKKKDYAASGIASARTANSEFKQFYDNIGKYQNTVGYLKKRSGNAYTLELKKYPTLVNMGLKLHSYNETGSAYTDDNFSSSYHVGKAYRGTRKTRYYLTPTSLGVTYVPVSVLKPLFIANLDTLCRLQRLSGGEITRTTFDNTTALNAVRSADGCIPTEVYSGGGWGTGGSARTQEVHTTDATEKIINNGDCEYDLNSVQVKVDYFFIDFLHANHNSTRILASKLNGMLNAPSGHGQNSYRDYTLDRFNAQENDTGTTVNDAAYTSMYEQIRMQRIVARVSVKLKIHMPYKSPVMQWMCYIGGGSPHFDMRMYDPWNDTADMGSNGVWYKYTTYYCQTR